MMLAVTDEVWITVSDRARWGSIGSVLLNASTTATPGAIV